MWGLNQQIRQWEQCRPILSDGYKHRGGYKQSKVEIQMCIFLSKIRLLYHSILITNVKYKFKTVQLKYNKK